jgi:hypothetical protein
MIYEIFDNTGAVINRISADPDFVKANYPGHYRDVTPPPPPVVPEPNIITKIAMITRFTDAEFVGILTAAKTDPEVEGWYVRFNAATTINLDDARTVSGVNMLYLKTLLTEARATAILTDPVQPAERP